MKMRKIFFYVIFSIALFIGGSILRNVYDSILERKFLETFGVTYPQNEEERLLITPTINRVLNGRKKEVESWQLGERERLEKVRQLPEITTNKEERVAQTASNLAVIRSYLDYRNGITYSLERYQSAISIASLASFDVSRYLETLPNTGCPPEGIR